MTNELICGNIRLYFVSNIESLSITPDHFFNPCCKQVTRLQIRVGLKQYMKNCVGLKQQNQILIENLMVI